MPRSPGGESQAIDTFQIGELLHERCPDSDLGLDFMMAASSTKYETTADSERVIPRLVTANSRPISAAESVFSIGELVMSILTHLPARQLFVLKRVNRKFNYLIRDTLPLRQATFMATKESVRKAKVNPPRPELDKPNPPLFNSYIPLVQGKAEDFEFAPFLSKSPRGSEPVSDDCGFFSFNDCSAGTGTQYCNLRWPASATGLPSIQNMFVTQPPVDAMIVAVSSEDLHRPIWELVRDDGGLKFGTVADGFLRAIASSSLPCPQLFAYFRVTNGLPGNKLRHQADWQW
jgi:hypothetical protein